MVLFVGEISNRPLSLSKDKFVPRNVICGKFFSPSTAVRRSDRPVPLCRLCRHLPFTEGESSPPIRWLPYIFTAPKAHSLSRSDDFIRRKADFITQVISSRRDFIRKADLSRRKTDLVEKDLNFLSKLRSFSGSGRRI